MKNLPKYPTKVKPADLNGDRLIVKLMRLVHTWYGWLTIAAIIAGVEWLLFATGSIDYTALIVLAVVAAIAGLMSFIEAMRGGVARSHRKPKKERTKKTILKGLFSRLSAASIVLFAGFFIGGAAVVAPLARYDQQFPATTQQQEAQPIKAADHSNAAAQRTANETNRPTQSQQPNTRTSTPAPVTDESGCDWLGDIPYETVTKEDKWLAEGYTRTKGGVNGWRKVCTDAHGNVISDTVTQEPIVKTIYYGTYTSEQALSKARSLCTGVPANSTFYGDCVAREMNKQGWYYQNGEWVYR